MTINLACKFLIWAAIFNWAMLLFWWLMIVFAHDFVYKMHSKWIKISVERFDAIHYATIIGLKVFIFVVFFVPYLVLRIFF